MVGFEQSRLEVLQRDQGRRLAETGPPGCCRHRSRSRDLGLVSAFALRPKTTGRQTEFASAIEEILLSMTSPGKAHDAGALGRNKCITFHSRFSDRRFAQMA